MMTKPRPLVLPLLAVILLVATSEASIFFWQVGDGQFNDPLNWGQPLPPVPQDPDNIPDANDVVFFNRGNVSPFTVGFIRQVPFPQVTVAAIDMLRIGHNTVTFSGGTLLGTSSSLTAGNTGTSEAERGLVVGYDANGPAVLTASLSGGLNAQYATIGSVANSSGTLNVTGNNNEFNVTGTAATHDLIVGLNGAGTINVSGGADVNVTGTTVLGRFAQGIGNVGVSGTGSTWTSNQALTIGLAGNGSLNVANGGVVSSVGGTIGSATGSHGTVSVDGVSPGGTPSRWTVSGGLVIGEGGSGTLQISNGGRVETTGLGPASIGQAEGGNGHVTVSSNSTLSLTRALGVGFGGLGTLTVDTGGKVTSSSGHIGHGIGSSGSSVSIDGSSSQWTITGAVFDSELVVGRYAGAGTLQITNGGRVDKQGSSHSYIGRDGFSLDNFSHATVSSGSLWTDSGKLHVGHNGKGKLTIDTGGAVSSVGATIGSNSEGTVFLDGRSVGMVTVDGDNSVWNVSGTGLSIGVSAVNILQEDARGEGTLVISNGGRVNNTGALGASLGEGGDSIGTVTVTGTGSTWSNSNNLVVGADDHGELLIENGAAVTGNEGYIGAGADATGTVTVSGAGSSLAYSGNVVIGNSGTGTLVIEDGASVTTAGFAFFGNELGGSGSATVTGTGSSWSLGEDLRVGNNNLASGAVTIEAGGAISNRFGYIGGQGTGSSITISDATWTNANALIVGHTSMSTGTVNVQAGGQVSSLSGYIGSSPNAMGTVIVSGTNAVWNNALDLNVGSFGQGSLAINTGGRVANTTGTLGRSPNSIGTATVSGSGSTWTNSDKLQVGNEGTGTLVIENGGSVSNVDGFIAKMSGSTGTATVRGAGSNWAMNRLSVGGDVTTSANGGTGTLRIEPGGKVTVAQDIAVFANGLLKLEGGVLAASEINLPNADRLDWTGGKLHTGLVNGNVVNKGGALAPGQTEDVAGTTTIIGNYTQQAFGALEIEIGGTLVNAQHDFVNVTGTTFLNGNLELDLINGFVPAPTDSFTVFNTATFINFFSNVTSGQRLTTTDGMGSFLVHYGPTSIFNPNQIVLSSFELLTLGGDFNLDGVWDCADINALTATVVAGTHDPGFDLNGDGLVNSQDVSVWLVNGGAMNPAQTSGNPFLAGDANLDGGVDGSDFGLWNANKFTTVAAWCSGDFNSDGAVDGSDFGIWNSNKFTSSGSMATVPEPSAVLALIGTAILVFGARRSSGFHPETTSRKTRDRVRSYFA